MIKVIYEDANKDAPYIFNDGAEIVLTIGGELYARETYSNSMSADVFNGIDDAWAIDNRFTGYYINKILDEIKPYAEKLHEQMGVSNGKGYYINEDIGYELEEKISDIIYDYNYNNDYEEAMVYLLDFTEFLYSTEEKHSPEGYGEIVENPRSYNYDNIIIDIDPERAVDIVYDLYIDDIVDASFKDTLKEIEKVHKKYINDDLEKLFYDNFIPRLIDECPEFSYDGKNFYYEGDLLE